MAHIANHIGGVCIDDVVRHLVHNEPLTCATEASDCVDAYSERQRDYESRVQDWFHSMIEFERSIQGSLKKLEERITRAEYPAVKQLEKSHEVVKSRFDNIQSALQLLRTPLTTPPTPSMMGAQLSQLSAKVNEMRNLLNGASTGAIRAKDAIHKFETSFTVLQVSPARSGKPTGGAYEDEIHQWNFRLAHVRQMYNTSCEDHRKLVQDSLLMTEKISTNHSIIDSLVSTLQLQNQADYDEHLYSAPTLAKELGKAVTDSIPWVVSLAEPRFEIQHQVWWYVDAFVAISSPFLLIPRRGLRLSLSLLRRPYSSGIIIVCTFISIGFFVMILVYLRQSEDVIDRGIPEGLPVSLHPIWDYLLASEINETISWMIPTGIFQE